MAPFSHADARAAFEAWASEVESGPEAARAAFAGDEVVGTVQVVFAAPPNQPHRADIAKLLVHRSARRRGVAQLLMEHAEAEWRAEGRTLLVLDTVTGADAERLYTRLGWTRVGVIPNYGALPRWSAVRHDRVLEGRVDRRLSRGGRRGRRPPPRSRGSRRRTPRPGAGSLAGRRREPVHLGRDRGREVADGLIAELRGRGRVEHDRVLITVDPAFRARGSTRVASAAVKQMQSTSRSAPSPSATAS